MTNSEEVILTIAPKLCYVVDCNGQRFKPGLSEIPYNDIPHDAVPICKALLPFATPMPTAESLSESEADLAWLNQYRDTSNDVLRHAMAFVRVWPTRTYRQERVKTSLPQDFTRQRTGDVTEASGLVHDLIQLTRKCYFNCWPKGEYGKMSIVHFDDFSEEGPPASVFAFDNQAWEDGLDPPIAVIQTRILLRTDQEGISAPVGRVLTVSWKSQTEGTIEASHDDSIMNVLATNRCQLEGGSHAVEFHTGPAVEFTGAELDESYFNLSH